MNTGDIPFLSPEGTPSPERIVPCYPAPRPVPPLAPYDEYESNASYPGWSSKGCAPTVQSSSQFERQSPWKVLGNPAEFEKRTETGNAYPSEDVQSISTLKRELQSSEAEIMALRSALDAASEEIR